MKGVQRLAQFKEDVLSCAEFLAIEAGVVLAERFLCAVEESLTRLAGGAQLGWPVACQDKRLSQVRTWRVAGFEKHLIFYRPTQSGVLAIRLLHGARDVLFHLRRFIE